MRRKIVFYKWALAIVWIAHVNATAQQAQQTQRQPIESLVYQEFQGIQQLPQVPPVHLHIERTANQSSSDLPADHILNLNLVEAENLTNKIGTPYRRDIIRLILAHEMGHQIQYGSQSNKAGLVYECQADVIAGFLIYQLMFIEGSEFLRTSGKKDFLDPTYQQLLKQQQARYEASLTAIFKEGSDHELQPSHPTDDERRIALRDGYFYGNIWTRLAFLQNPPVGLTASDRADMTQTLEKAEKLLDFLPGDDVVTWSKRQAEKIVHINLLNCKNIVFYTEYDVDSSNIWFKIKYNQQITNIGDKVLTFNYYNQVYSKQKSDPKNTLYWKLLDNDAQTVTLSPNETTNIRGRLEWIQGDDQSVAFVYPGMAGALFSCSSLTDPPEVTPGMIDHFFSEGVSQSDKDILDMFLSETDSLLAFIGGIGKIKQPQSADNPIYLSKLQISTASSTEIQYDNASSRYRVHVQYDVEAPKSEAMHTITELISTLSDLDYTVVERKLSDENDGQWDIMGKGGIPKGAIYLHYSIAYQVYDTSLDVFGK
jgi:hypothetical protein